MRRAVNLEETKSLEELIPAYAEDKQNLDHYKKLCDSENSEIKRQMTEQNMDSCTIDSYTVKKIVSVRESVNEEKLLEVLKKHHVNDIIKTREYVDMDALEDYLYSHELSEDLATDLDKCREKMEIVQLRMSKKKENK